MKKVILAGVAMAAAACGGETGPASMSNEAFCQEVLPRVAAFMEEAAAANPVPDDARYGGTVAIGASSDIPDGMNSAVSSDFAATQHQQFVNLMTLIDYDENREPAPYLAERFEVAPDNRSITFHLRRDVVWHDGEPTDAHDVAFTYETVTDPATGYPNSSYWDAYVRGPEGVEVIDDYTVRVHLEPHQGFMDPFRVLAILPEHLLGDVPREELRLHPFGQECPVGNGPFVFASHTAQDRWIFEANPAFSPSLGGRPFLDRYVYRVIPEPTTLLAELLTGGVDIAISVRPDDAARIIESEEVDLKRVQARQYVFVVWNARREKLADPRVRRAITMGTDRTSIVNALLQGYGFTAQIGIPPFHWAYEPDLVDGIPYDPDGARALLDEAGWMDRDGDGVRENENGVPLSFTIKYNEGNEMRQGIAEIMQSQLADVGIDAQPEVVEWGTMLDQMMSAEREFEGAVMSLVADYKLDDRVLFHSDYIEGDLAWSGTDNPEIDRLLDALAATVDQDLARPLWRELGEVIMEEQPYTYFYFPERLHGVRDRVMGEVMDERGEWINVREWYIAPESR